MDKGSIILELNRGPVLVRTREDTFNITMEVTITMEEVRTTIVAPRWQWEWRKQQLESFQPINTNQEGSEPHYLYLGEYWTAAKPPGGRIALHSVGFFKYLGEY